MMTIVINRVNSVIRIPANAIGEKTRVERIVGLATEQIERALAEAGMSSEGHLCIRNLRTIVKMRLRDSDSALAATLAGAIAIAIDHTRRGNSELSVFYTSRAHALIDMISSAMRADFTHAWAWNQLAIWHGDRVSSASEAAAKVMRALMSEPRLAIAALSHVARDRFAFIELLKWATPSNWIALARATLNATGSPIQLEFMGSIDQASHSAAESIAIRIAQRSAIADALSRAQVFNSPRTTARALAALVLLEVEPGKIRVVSEDSLGLIDVIEQQLYRAISGSVLAGRDHGETEAPRVTREQSLNANGEATTVNPIVIDSIANRFARPLADVRRSASTRAGGLLYLINLSARIALPALIPADDRLAQRGSRWTLHQLALLLQTLDSRDPAALAFAGLLPDSPPPDFNQPPPRDDELLALEKYRARIVTSLRDALRHFPDASYLSDAALLEFVCARPAEVVADPGWIEAHFALDQVSTEIRRVGLDLDPGWVPWLGVAVRFVYA